MGTLVATWTFFDGAILGVPIVLLVTSSGTPIIAFAPAIFWSALFTVLGDAVHQTLWGHGPACDRHDGDANMCSCSTSGWAPPSSTPTSMPSSRRSSSVTIRH